VGIAHMGIAHACQHWSLIFTPSRSDAEEQLLHR
jgi:hypothetical protein